MSTLTEKLDKQFAWQRTRHESSGDPMDLFVSVDDLALYLAAQTGQELPRVRVAVKAEMERRAGAGLVRRWVEVHGRSLRVDRDDHYFLTEIDTEGDPA